MKVYTKTTKTGVVFRSDSPPTFLQRVLSVIAVLFYALAGINLCLLSLEPILSFLTAILSVGCGLIFSSLKKKLNAAYCEFISEIEEQEKKKSELIAAEARQKDAEFLAEHSKYEGDKSAEQIRAIRLLTEMRDMCIKYLEADSGYFDSERFESLCEQYGAVQCDGCDEIIALHNEMDRLTDLCDKKQNRIARRDSEHRMRCNVCGHIYCYTDKDELDNIGNNLLSAISSFGAVGAATGGGTRLDAYALHNNAERYSGKVVDFKRCPNCNSIDVEPFEEENTTPQTPAPKVVSSSVDEIKKYKALLDMGIITQEEFDAKKKQLLGL